MKEDIVRLLGLKQMSEEINKLKQKRKEEGKALTMSYEQFKLFFEYSKCNMSEENIQKLWKYTNKKKEQNIDYTEFVNFAVYLIHSLGAFAIAKYKQIHNFHTVFNFLFKTVIMYMLIFSYGKGTK